MAIALDHTIVPAIDQEASAQFFARIFGLKYEGLMGVFSAVPINDTLTLDFHTCDQFETHHYAFHVSDEEFDAMFERVKAEGIPYGSAHFAQDDMQINTRRDGRGFYFQDPNGHSLELLTRR